jgi:Kef-type K+ transport system membrane component KefB
MFFRINWARIPKWRMVVSVVMFSSMVVWIPLALVVRSHLGRPVGHEQLAGAAVMVGVCILYVGALVRGYLRQADKDKADAAREERLTKLRGGDQ